MTKTDGECLIRSISKKSLQYPLSCIVREADTGELIAARLFSIGDRNSSEDSGKFFKLLKIKVKYIEE